MNNRRKSKRFLPDSRAFACLRPDFVKLGKIKDISRSGLAFRYVSNQDPAKEPNEIDIFLSGNNFFLTKMKCRVVYDLNSHNDSASASELTEWQCGVEFGKITNEQILKLTVFLNNHVTGTA